MGTVVIGFINPGGICAQSSADTLSKVDTTESKIFELTDLSIYYPDGMWGDLAPNVQPVTGQYNSLKHKVSLKIMSPATGFNGIPPTLMYTLHYVVTGNDTGKVYLEGQGSVFGIEGMNSLELEFLDLENQDESYRVDTTAMEILEGIHPPVIPYSKDGHAIVTK